MQAIHVITALRARTNLTVLLATALRGLEEQHAVRVSEMKHL